MKSLKTKMCKLYHCNDMVWEEIMRKRNKIILSLILFVVGIALAVCGIMLFNALPNISLELYSPKDSMMATGVIFVFLFAVGALGGSIAFLISALAEDEY